MTLTADEFAAAFHPTWRADIPADYSGDVPDSVKSLWQSWTWTWEADPNLPVVYRALKSTNENCGQLPPGNAAGSELLIIPVNLHTWSDDRVWELRGPQMLAAWALPSEPDGIPGASGWVNYPEWYPRNAEFIKVHPDFPTDAPTLTDVPDSPRFEGVMVGHLTNFSIAIRVLEPGDPLDTALVSGMNLLLVEPLVE